MANDYGTINGLGNQTDPTTIKRGQVFEATHWGDGRRLPLMNRSFISFSYGGKYIEDFDLIATISGDRLNRKGYAEFDDTVTTYDNLDGQHYWATHYRANQMDFTLSTDGIDQKQLDNFLHWFKAGIHRELILSEHPNRAIMAHVSQPPTLNLLPFETDVTFNVSGQPFTTKTTLYKGDIELSLVMDKPHWYAIKNILGERVTKDGKDFYEDYWLDPNTNTNVSVTSSKDALKILYEDGIPLGSMIDTNMLLGNGAYANVEEQDECNIWSKSEGAEDFFLGVGARIHGEISESTVDEPIEAWTLFIAQAELELDTENEEEIIAYAKQLWQADDTYKTHTYIYPNGIYVGQLAGAFIDATADGITSLGKYVATDTEPQAGYFFYAGTAPAYTQISFTLTPEISDYKVVTPCNADTSLVPYNTITIESTTKQELRFTTPNVYTSYNKVIKLFDDRITSDSTYSWEKLRKEIRDTIRHPAVRAWAISVIEYAELLAQQQGDSTGKVKYAYLSDIKQSMQYFLTIPDSSNPNQIPTAEFFFDSETGKATGKFKYRKMDVLPTITVESDSHSWNLDDWGSAQSGNFEAVEEDVGDMLRSNYIIIQDRNYPTENGKVIGWYDTDSADARKYAHRITHDVNTPLTNLSILYKNMYL